jgi:CHRD domain/PEP-CTERM motif
MKLSHALPAAALVTLTLAAVPASAVTIVYQAILAGANESPPVASAGVGVGLVTFDTTLNTMRVQTTFAGLTGLTTVAHIHCCTAVPGAGTVGVATTTPTFPGFPAGATFGSYDVTFDMTLASSFNAAYITNNGGTPATAFAAFLTGAAAGKAYLNIHSSFATGGEIRGFLSPVPEPATYAMMFAGLAGLGWVARRRQRV